MEIKKELEKVKNKVEWFERDKRKNNIVMSWLKFDTNNTEALKMTMCNFINTHLGVTVEIKETRKLGEKTCLIELENEQEKVKIMENKGKLKNFKEEKIYINNDLMKQDRVKQIRKRVKEAIENRKQVKVGYSKITIDENEWIWNKNKGKLELTNAKN